MRQKKFELLFEICRSRCILNSMPRRFFSSIGHNLYCISWWIYLRITKGFWSHCASVSIALAPRLGCFDVIYGQCLHITKGEMKFLGRVDYHTKQAKGSSINDVIIFIPLFWLSLLHVNTVLDASHEPAISSNQSVCALERISTHRFLIVLEYQGYKIKTHQTRPDLLGCWYW